MSPRFFLLLSKFRFCPLFMLHTLPWRCYPDETAPSVGDGVPSKESLPFQVLPEWVHSGSPQLTTSMTACPPPASSCAVFSGKWHQRLHGVSRSACVRISTSINCLAALVFQTPSLRLFLLSILLVQTQAQALGPRP